MKRPWQIWLLFALCLATVLPPLGWLTLKALELDRAQVAARRQAESARRDEANARRQAELQELISTALWRMDSMLTPLVAQEAARPYFVYEPFYQAPGRSGGKGDAQPIPSPILVQPSEYVLLHFQLSPDGAWSSPQSPLGPLRDAALQNGVSPENISSSGERLQTLRSATDRRQLLALAPEQMLPQVELQGPAWANNVSVNYGGDPLGIDNTAVIADLGLPQLDSPANPPAGSPPAFQSQQQAEQNPAVAQVAGPQQAASPLQQGASNPPQLNNPRNQMLRGGNDFERRNRASQNYAFQQVVQQRANAKILFETPSPLVREGVSRPIWVGRHLLLARRVVRSDGVWIQGCWLDWQGLKQALLGQIADLLPDVDLVPVDQNSVLRRQGMLATLPAQVVVTQSVSIDNAGDRTAPLAARGTDSGSAIRVSLVAAWICSLLAATAVAVLLRGVMKLSERRGAFVSAVTHELRTPLTTFRMYAEMLAGGMLPTEEKRQRYLETLRVEADRLAHLVENVLQYARLERGRTGKRRERVSVQGLIERVHQRFADRVTQSNMKLVIEVEDNARRETLNTDPAALEQILFNLVDNACKYAQSAADPRIHLAFSTTADKIEIRVADHGPGIPPQHVRSLFKPFSKSADQAANTAPGVGLGLALCRRLAKELGGQLQLEMVPDNGAIFVLALPRGE